MKLNQGDLLRLVTSATATVDVLVAYSDEGSNPALDGSVTTAIATATTTTILAGPGAGTSRTVESISIRNKSASTCTVTPTLAGSSTVELYEATLLADGNLHWTPATGWVATSASTLGVVNLVILGEDVANIADNTLANVTGLSFPVTADLTYKFRAVVPYTAAATTTGARFTANGPALTHLSIKCINPQGATADVITNGAAWQIPAAATTTSVVAGQVATVEGVVKPSASGTVAIQFASEVADSAITAKAGAVLEWARVL